MQLQAICDRWVLIETDRNLTHHDQVLSGHCAITFIAAIYAAKSYEPIK